MAMQEIPRQDWVRFCNDYSRDHEGWVATVEVQGGDVGDHVEARDMPLRGVTFEEKGTDKGSIQIYLDQGSNTNETHTISRPTHVFVSHDSRGEELEVDAEDGTKTLVRLSGSGASKMSDRL